MDPALPYAVPAVEPIVRPSGANAVLGYVVPLTLGLWFGGLVTLILFVSMLFVKARAVAINGAPVLFFVFERYQLALAAVALLTLAIWRWTGRSKLKTTALASTLLATGLAVLQIAYITPTINASRDADRAKFDQFHHLASMNYTTVAAFVLIAWLLAIAASRRGARIIEAA